MYFDVGKSDFFDRLLGPEILFAPVRIITAATDTSYLEQIRAAAALHRRTLRSSFMMKFPLSYSWYITFYSVWLAICGFVRRSRTIAKKRL